MKKGNPKSNQMNDTTLRTLRKRINSYNQDEDEDIPNGIKEHQQAALEEEEIE